MPLSYLNLQLVFLMKHSFKDSLNFLWSTNLRRLFSTVWLQDSGFAIRIGDAQLVEDTRSWTEGLRIPLDDQVDDCGYSSEDA